MNDDTAILDEVETTIERFGRVRGEIGRVIFGQEGVVEDTLITLLAGGHALLVGVPGLAKTRLVETLGVVLGLEPEAGAVHARPDAGRHSRLRGAGGRRDRAAQLPLHPRPDLRQLLMADEINRASPRTQAALLQAMQEREVTVAGQDHRCPRRSTCWRPRTRSSRRAPIPCPRRSSTGSSCRSTSTIPTLEAERRMMIATTDRHRGPGPARARRRRR